LRRSRSPAGRSRESTTTSFPPLLDVWWLKRRWGPEVGRLRSDQAAQPRVAHHPLHPDLERRGPERQVALLGAGGHAAVRAGHRVAQLAVDLFLLPAEVLEVLGPLEVAHHHAARV